MEVKLESHVTGNVYSSVYTKQLCDRQITRGRNRPECLYHDGNNKKITTVNYISESVRLVSYLVEQCS